MKKLLLVLCCILCVNAVHARVTIVQILEAGTISDDFVTLYLDNGEIVQVNPHDDELLARLRALHQAQRPLELTRISQNSDRPDLVTAAHEAPRSGHKEMFSPERLREQAFSTTDPLEKANITLLPTYQAAQTLMDQLRGDTGDDSQCYNRAHVWTYETLANSNVNLGKTWIFFSQKYIKEFSYKWWFHVAPYARVNDANQTYVLDRGFTRVPYNLVNWKNLFMKNQADCPVITNYLDYETAQDSAYCYLMFSSQYYWQPYQLRNLATRTERTWGYRRANLEIAYEDALIRWDQTMPELASVPSVNVPPTVVVAPVPGPTPTPSWTPRVEVPRYYAPIRANFTKGTEVIDENNRRAVVIGQMNSLEVVIQYEGSSMTAIKLTTQLGARVSAFLAFKREVEIIDENNNFGEIREVYSNGVALIDYDDYSDQYVRLSERVGYAVRSLGGFTKGQSIIDRFNNTGHVQRLYSNGVIVFDKDGTRRSNLLTISEISAEVSNLQGYRRGASVIHRGLMAQVRSVFASGQVLIDYEARGYSDGVVLVHELGLEVSTYLGIARGDTVVYGELLAKVLHVFNDGTALIDYRDRGYSDSVVAVAQLRKVR